MAKIFISTKSINELKNNSIFELEEIKGNVFSLLSFKKLNVEHTNLTIFDNGDFVASAGTIIYKGFRGSNSLQRIYKEFKNEVAEIRENCFGNFTLCIKKNNQLTIFVDDSGIHDLFYKIDERGYSLGTSLYDVALIEKEHLSLNNDHVVQLCAQYCLLGGVTFFNEIKRLDGKKKIVVDLHNNKVFLKKIESNTLLRTDFSTIRDYVNHMVNAMDLSLVRIRDCFDKPAISMTGGLDSRILLAAFLKNNIKPDLLYGVGNTSLTNTKVQDLEINKVFAQRYGLNLKLQDWKNPQPIDLHWEELAMKYGFLSTVYCGANIFHELLHNQNDFIEYGYFGEPFRNVDWIENRTEETFSLSEFVFEFYLNKEILICLPDTKEFTNGIYQGFLRVCTEHNLNPERIHVNNFQILHNVYRRNADSVMLNLTNLFCFSASVLSQKGLMDLSEVIPKSYKLNSKFMLMLLNKLHADVLKVSFFSHTKKWTFDADKLELIRKENPFIERISSIVKRFRFNTKLLEMGYSKLLKGKNAMEIKEREKLRDFFRRRMRLKDIEKVNHLSFLSKYAQNSWIISSILKKEKIEK